MQIAERQTVGEWIAAQPLSGSVATQSVVDVLPATTVNALSHAGIARGDNAVEARGVAGATATYADAFVPVRAERSGVPEALKHIEVNAESPLNSAAQWFHKRLDDLDESVMH